jgi:hypothetical protein
MEKSLNKIAEMLNIINLILFFVKRRLFDLKRAKKTITVFHHVFHTRSESGTNFTRRIDFVNDSSLSSFSFVLASTAISINIQFA